MKFFLPLCTVCVLSTGTGCATVGKSILLGTATGAMAGASSGAYWGVQNREKYALQAALWTGALGGIAGYFAHEALEKRDQKIREATLFNIDKFGIGPAPPPEGTEGPVLIAPKVEARWMGTQVQGKKLIEGHRVWVITEDSGWPANQPLQLQQPQQQSTQPQGD